MDSKISGASIFDGSQIRGIFTGREYLQNKNISVRSWRKLSAAASTPQSPPGLPEPWAKMEGLQSLHGAAGLLSLHPRHERHLSRVLSPLTAPSWSEFSGKWFLLIIFQAVKLKYGKPGRCSFWDLLGLYFAQPMEPTRPAPSSQLWGGAFQALSPATSKGLPEVASTWSNWNLLTAGFGGQSETSEI